VRFAQRGMRAILDDIDLDRLDAKVEAERA